MSHSLFTSDSPHPEPSRLTAFAENALNRDSEHRDETSVEKALSIDGTHLLAFAGEQLILKHDGQVLDPLFARYELAELKPDWDNAVLLGYKKNGEPRLAVPVGVAADDLASQYKATDMRALWREHLFEGEILGEAAQAVSLIRWNSDNRFCGRCGSVTEGHIGGYKRVCTACQHMIFPRTDPVVIMLVVDEAKNLCLLGRSHHFAPGMYSCLAGFVEPGETIENAVRRETHEEASIVTGRIRYHASQPWPMPHTLMIGCYAEAKSTEIHIDDKELDDCRWFTPEETLDMLNRTDANGNTSPPKGAIAHRLMRDWVEWKR